MQLSRSFGCQLSRPRSGFTLVEIMIVVGVMGLLTSLALPSFMKARNTSQQTSCINSLRQLDNAKEQAALAYGLSEGASIAAASVNEYIRKGAPVCPGGGEYTYNVIGVRPTCNITTPTLHMAP